MRKFLKRLLERWWIRILITCHKFCREQSRKLARYADTERSLNRDNAERIRGLLQAIRDKEEIEADLREQLVQVRAELEGAAQQNRMLEGEIKVNGLQMKALLAGHETLLSWLRTQKSLLEAESAKAIQSRRLGDGDLA